MLTFKIHTQNRLRLVDLQRTLSSRRGMLCGAALLCVALLGTQACGGGRDYAPDDFGAGGSGLTPTGGSTGGSGSGSGSGSGTGTGSGTGSGTTGSGTSPTTPGTSCTGDAQCAPELHCEFGNMSQWTAGTQGSCHPACARNNDCALGQLCTNGRCYSQLTCDPNNHNTDCPPAEVCNVQAQRCGAPPHECHFSDQCPNGWSCDLDNVCRDPQRAQIGSCTQDANCNAQPACAGQTCVCTAQHCSPRTCTTNQACGAGNVCISGGCRPTRTCVDQSGCTPYSMVCASGHCVPPDPCGQGNSCPVGMTCYTNLTPPSCLPTGSNQCSRDEQCGAGAYCDLFTGACKSGCRNDTECTAKCGTLTPGNQCICGASHQCSAGRPGSGGGGGGGTSGGSCGSLAECSAGSACAPNDPMDMTCAFDSMFGGTGADSGFGGFGGLGGLAGICPKSCHTVCDLMLSLIIDTCPNGTTCQAPSGVLLDLMTMLLGGGTDAPAASTTTGFCY